MATSRMNLPNGCEEILNNQINAELTAAYSYSSMSTFFASDRVALHGCSEYFCTSARDSAEKAKKLSQFLTLRGGRHQFREISPPQEWENAEKVFLVASEIEKHLYAQYLQICTVAQQVRDPQTEQFIEDAILPSQMENLKESADNVTTLKRIGGDGIGLYMFDRQLSKKLNVEPRNERPSMPGSERLSISIPPSSAQSGPNPFLWEFARQSSRRRSSSD